MNHRGLLNKLPFNILINMVSKWGSVHELGGRASSPRDVDFASEQLFLANQFLCRSGKND